MPGVKRTLNGVVQTATGAATTALGDTIDSFEGAGIANYTTIQGGNLWSVVEDSAEARDGDHYLRYTGTAYDVLVDDSLENQPAAGDEWRTWFKMTSGSSNSSLYIGHAFGVQDIGSDADQPGYRARFEPHDNTLYLQVDPDGNGFDVLASNFSASGYSAGDWMEMRVLWPADPTSTAIEVEVYNASGTSLGSVSSVDDSGSGGFTSGGWGYLNNGAMPESDEMRVDFSRFV